MKNQFDFPLDMQQLRRLQSVFKDRETSIAMRMSNRRDKYGVLFTTVSYEVTHENMIGKIISTCPKYAVDRLMAITHITGVEQYCRTYLQGRAA